MVETAIDTDLLAHTGNIPFIATVMIFLIVVGSALFAVKHRNLLYRPLHDLAASSARFLILERIKSHRAASPASQVRSIHISASAQTICDIPQALRSLLSNVPFSLGLAARFESQFIGLVQFVLIDVL